MRPVNEYFAESKDLFRDHIEEYRTPFIWQLPIQIERVFRDRQARATSSSLAVPKPGSIRSPLAAVKA